MELLGFDIEIAKCLPEEELDWKKHRPLGITCAAAYGSDGKVWNWWAHDRTGQFTDMMRDDQVVDIVMTLHELSRTYLIVTWNGLGFDFDILAEESGLKNHCVKLAMGHIDPMFQILCTKGYPVGLDAASKGMGLPGKPEGMSGAVAPRLWKEGAYHRVLHYVTMDAKNTVRMAMELREKKVLSWTSNAGRPNQCSFSKLMSVTEALAIPEPDTSWMDNPMTRESLYEWTRA